jgi:hypothetical protein
LRVFPVGAEHPLDMSVQRPHHADPSMYQEVAVFGTDHATDRGLTFMKAPLSLRLHTPEL